MSTEKNISLAILGIVAVIAIVGSVLLFSQFSQQANTGNVVAPQKGLSNRLPLRPNLGNTFNVEPISTEQAETGTKLKLDTDGIKSGKEKKPKLKCYCAGTVKQKYSSCKVGKTKQDCVTGNVDIQETMLGECSNCQNLCNSYLSQKQVTTSNCPIGNDCKPGATTVVTSTATCK